MTLNKKKVPLIKAIEEVVDRFDILGVVDKTNHMVKRNGVKSNILLGHSYLFISCRKAFSKALNFFRKSFFNPV